MAIVLQRAVTSHRHPQAVRSSLDGVDAIRGAVLLPDGETLPRARHLARRRERGRAATVGRDVHVGAPKLQRAGVGDVGAIEDGRVGRGRGCDEICPGRGGRHESPG